MANSYFFSGPNGVGKSTVINLVAEFMPEARTIKGSSLLMQWLGVTTHAELDVLPEDLKKLVANQGMQQLVLESPDPLLIDAHLVHCDKGVARPCAYPWIKSVGSIVVMRAAPEVMLTRIQRDELTGTRVRSTFPEGASEEQKLDIIATYLHTNEAVATSFSNMHEIPLMHIDNSGAPHAAVQQFLDHVQPQSIAIF